MHADCLKLVMWLVTPNHNVSFQSTIIITPLWNVLLSLALTLSWILNRFCYFNWPREMKNFREIGQVQSLWPISPWTLATTSSCGRGIHQTQCRASLAFLTPTTWMSSQNRKTKFSIFYLSPWASDAIRSCRATKDILDTLPWPDHQDRSCLRGPEHEKIDCQVGSWSGCEPAALARELFDHRPDIPENRMYRSNNL